MQFAGLCVQGYLRRSTHSERQDKHRRDLSYEMKSVRVLEMMESSKVKVKLYIVIVSYIYS